MNTFFQTKTVDNSVLDVNDKGRQVKVAISQVGSKDLDNDIIDSGAYTKTISERGPKGSNLIWHLTDHNPSLKNAVGKFSELFMEGNYLVGVTNIPNTTWGNDVLELYKTGNINQHSIGFRTIKSEPVDAGKSTEYNLIKEVLLYEGSAVLWGANPNTPTLSAGKNLTIEEKQSELESLQKEMTVLSKSLKDGRFTDESFELIEIRFKQVQERISELFKNITQPVQTVEPVNELDKLKEAIQLITLKNYYNVGN